MNNEAALAAMDRAIAKLRSIAKLPEQIAPEVAAELRAQILSNVARGVGPDGAVWQPTADRHIPLQNAGAALKVRAIGTRVIARLEGHTARHHLGFVKGGVQRRILPGRRSLGPLVAATRAIVKKAFAARFKGA